MTMTPHYLQRQLYIVSSWSSIETFITTGLLSTHHSRKTCYPPWDLRFSYHQHKPQPKFSWTVISWTLWGCGEYCEHPISCISSREWHCWYWSKASRSTPRGGYHILTSLTSTKPVESSERTDFKTFLGIWLASTSIIRTSGCTKVSVRKTRWRRPQWPIHLGIHQTPNSHSHDAMLHFYIAPSRNFEWSCSID